MTEVNEQTVDQATRERIKAAIELASDNCGGKPRLLAALNITESWMYACMKHGRIPLILSLKLQVLTNGKYNWYELCPTEHQTINAVAEYLVN
jgi:hypothetical protein